MRPRALSPRPPIAAALALAFALTRPAAAEAREPSRVLIVRVNDAKRDPVLAETYLRVASELRSAGFDVGERAAHRDDDPRSEVEAESASVATILIRRPRPAGTAGASSPNEIDIWIADHITHKTVLRKIDAQDDPATLAMRVLELMRASLIEPFAMESLASSTPPDDVTRFVQARAPTLPAPRPESPAAAPSPHVFLDVGLALLWASPDLGLAVAPAASLAFPLAGPFRLGVLAMGPAFGATVHADAGVAHIRQELGLVELAWSPGPGARTWLQPRASMGLGAYHLQVDGDAREPYRDGHDATWALLTSLSAGGSLALSHTARVVLEGRLLLGFPRPVIRFASEDVGSALRPSLAVTTALEVDL